MDFDAGKEIEKMTLQDAQELIHSKERILVLSILRNDLRSGLLNL